MQSVCEIPVRRLSVPAPADKPTPQQTPATAAASVAREAAQKIDPAQVRRELEQRRNRSGE